eukprot:TRINITY_DN5378_c0_g1_i1.p1 TRINITY_DN5378_c0_g1~~TRINITY_DN5378_c0_g1_i1.p1  ORF type:complete len:745 (+),score=170.34 TRINITY_DN5378_c0_g1_i1:15-2249(+)
MTSNRVFLSNLHKYALEKEISEAFNKFGLDVGEVHIDYAGPRSLCRGWVTVSSPGDVSKAMSLQGSVTVKDQALSLSMEPPPAPAPRGGRAPQTATEGPGAKELKGVKKPAASSSPVPSSSLSQPSPPSSATPSPSGPSQPAQPPAKQSKTRATRRAARDAQDAGAAWQPELDKLRTSPQYASSLNIVSSEPELSFHLHIIPAPDFPYELDALRLLVSVPSSYPQHPCFISVLNEEAQIPLKIRTNIETEFYKRACTYSGTMIIGPNKSIGMGVAQARPMILNMMTWLTNHLEDLFIDKTITQKFLLAQQGIQIVVNKKQPAETTATPPPRSEPSVPIPTPSAAEGQEASQEQPGTASSSSDQDSDSESAGGETSEYESDDDEPETQDPAVGPTITTSLRGTRVRFDEIELSGLGILVCTSLCISLACQRCHARVEVMDLPRNNVAAHEGPADEQSSSSSTSSSSSASSSETSSTTSPSEPKPSIFSQECSHCKSAHSLSLRAEIMHEFNSVLGYLDITGLAPFDLLPSDFRGNCFECNASVMFPRLAYGRKHDTNCMACFAKVSVTLHHPTFTRVRAKAPATNPNASRGREVVPAESGRKKKEAGLTVGAPLPDKGACKHYRHSYRLLRFPCCGKLFPCDLCHELASDHDSKWATKMVCGFCSREQKFEQYGECKFCGKRLTKKGASEGGAGRYWEGGAGCRDRSRMNNKDPHKFKNSVLKTKSKKHERVGKEGKERREAKAK